MGMGIPLAFCLVSFGSKMVDLMALALFLLFLTTIT